MSAFEEKFKKYEEQKQKEKAEKQQKISAFEEKFKKYEEQRYADKIYNLTSNWVNEGGKIVDNYNSRYADGNTKWRGDAGEYYSSVSEAVSKQKSDAKEILDLIAQYGGNYNPEWIKNISDTLAQNNKQYDQILDYATQDRDFWSRFPTEADYQSALDYQKRLDMDIPAAQKEVDQMQRIYDAWSEASNNIEATKIKINQLESEARFGISRRAREEAQAELAKAQADLSRYENVLSQFEGGDGFKDEITKLNQQITLATRAQKARDLPLVASPESTMYDPEFATKSQYVPEDTSDVNDYSMRIFNGEADPRYLFLNDRDEYNRVVNDFALKAAEGGTTLLAGNFDVNAEVLAHMTEEQKALFNYYYNVGGAEAADEYYQTIAEGINQKRGMEIYESIKDKPLLQRLYAIPAGLDSAITGFNELRDDKYTPPSSTQFASSMVSENLADKGLKTKNKETGKWEPVKIAGKSTAQLFYDLNTATANMLPSIMVSALAEAALPTVGEGAAIFSATSAKTIGKLLGAATMGASAAGNAKNEMLELGYSVKAANNYAALVGASEAGLEYLLGSIPGLSSGDGAFSTLAEKVFKNVDNALAKVAITVADGLDEALEEGLQSVLEPWYKEIATGVDFDSPDAQEVLYSSLLGFLMGEGFSVGGKVINSAANIGHTISVGKAVKSEGLTDKVINRGLELTGTKAYNVAAKASKKATNYRVGKLYASLNESQIKSSFSKKGIASDIANALTSVVRGKQITNADLKKIINNDAALGEMNTILGTNIAKGSDIKAARKTINTAYEAQTDSLVAELDKNQDAMRRLLNGEIVSDKSIANILKDDKAREILNLRTGAEITADTTVRAVKEAVAEANNDYSRKGSAMLYAALLDMGENGARGFLNVVQGSSVGIAEAAKAFNAIYRAGMQGIALSDVKSSYLSELTMAQRLAAYEYGVMDGLTSKTETKVDETVDNAVDEEVTESAEEVAEEVTEEPTTEAEISRESEVEEGAIVTKGGETIVLVKENTKEQTRIIDMGKKLGVEVAFGKITKNGKNIDGLFDGKVLYINPQTTSGNAAYILFKHEFTHFLEKSTKYINFAKEVTESKAFSEWLKKKGFKNSTEYYAQIIADYKQIGKDLEDGGAQKEAVANFCAEMLYAKDDSMQRFVDTLSADHKRTFGELIRDFIEWIKKKLGKTDEIAMLEKKYAEVFQSKRFDAVNGERVVDANKTFEDDTQLSYTPSERDIEYLDAVNRGDMETAQRMVDEAAKEAGYKTNVYHGTNASRFYIFDFSKDERNNNQMFFSSNRKISETYGPNVMSLKINTKNFLVVDADGEWWSGFDDKISKRKAEELYYDNLKRLSDKYYDLNAKQFSFPYGSEEYKDNFNASQKAYQEYETLKQRGGVWSDEYISGTTYTVANYAKDNGYDGVTIKNVIDVGDKIDIDEVLKNEKKYSSTVYAVFSPDKVKSADPVTYDDNGNVIPLSQRFNSENDDIRYAYTPYKEATVDELIAQYKDGRLTEEQFRDALVNKKPKTDPISLANTTPEDFNTTPPAKRKTGENNVDGERDTIIARGASKLFSEEFKEEAKADEFIMRYKTIKNKDALRKAAADLDENGEDGVRRWFMKPVANGVSLNDVVKGYILLERYKEIGDIEGQVAVAQKLSEMGTMGGQVVQSFTILSRFTPEGMLVFAQRVLNDVRQRMIETQSEAWLNKHAESLKLTDADIEYIYNRTILASQMPDGRDKKIMLAEIASKLQSKIPPAKGQSIKALQRISMLLNPKTIIRNVLGNTTIAPVHWLSDWIGMPLDAILAIKTGRRTKGIKTNVAEDAKASWSGFKYAIEDWLKDINTQEDLDRFEIDKKGGKSFYESGKLAPAARMLNAMDRLTSFTLAAGDRPFYEYWFSRSLNSQMAANKTTTPTSEMIEIATAEALERTWQDRNAVTEMVSKMKGAVNTLSIAGYGLGDVFIKFTKTPANIAKAIYDFSPVGFATVVRDSIRFNKAVKSGKGVAIAQRNLVKSFGNAVAGTLMYVLAVALYKSGRLVGKSDDDKDVAAFEKWVQGIPSYSVKLFGKWFSYEWMQPIGSVAAIVSDYMEAKEFEGDDKFQPIVTALKSGGEVFYNQSFLKSFQTLFTADNIVDGFFEAVLDDPSSFVPQILSQFANAGDDVRRTTFDKTSPIKSAINAIKNKIPGLRNTLTEDVDVFGRVVPNSQTKVGNAFFNPANTYVDTSDEVTNHVYGLYKALGNRNMIPAKAGYSIDINGTKYILNPEERAEYQTIMGSVSYKIIEGLLEDDFYNSYSPSEQEVVIKNVYAYANAVARANFNAKMSYELLKNYNALLTRSKYDAMTEDEKREAYRNGILKEYADILDTDENGVVAYFVNKGTKTAIQNALYANNVEAAILALERGKENVGKYSENEDDVKSYTSNMRAGVTNAMKEEYILAYYEGDEQKMAEIKQMLTDIGLYENVSKTLKEWRESVTK